MSASVIELRRDDGIWRRLSAEAALALKSGCRSRRLLGLVLDSNDSELVRDYAAQLRPDQDWTSCNGKRFPILVGICPSQLRQDLIEVNPHLDQKIDVVHRAGSFLVLSVRGGCTELFSIPLPSMNSNRAF